MSESHPHLAITAASLIGYYRCREFVASNSVSSHIAIVERCRIGDHQLVIMIMIIIILTKIMVLLYIIDIRILLIVYVVM